MTERIGKILFYFSFISFCLSLIVALPIKDPKYWSERNEIILYEKSISFGSDIFLSSDEITVNQILMDAKNKELAEGFEDEAKFLPHSNFLKAKSEIEKSKVFEIIKKLPKGGLLHAHDVGTVSQEYILNTVTYRPNLYACDINGKLELKFLKAPADNFCDWKLLSDLRKDPESERNINKRIVHQMTMLTENPIADYPNGHKAWIKFQNLFYFLGSFMRYRPVFEDYYYQLLKENYEDKILYIELRVSLPKIYELNGRIYSPLKVLQIIKTVIDRFMQEHPDFVGVKLIYSRQRNASVNELNEFLNNFKQIKNIYPSLIAGLDLVGHEDKGTPLMDFADQLHEFSKEGVTFFHAGETDWNGLSVDQNLIDAVLLNTKRIGHGFALPKHPKVMELVKQKNIAIEVNPISNQILNLVADLRNHPASILFAENYPVVVCSDDPGLWGAKGLSYDFYEAFMGIMSSESDLRALKKLALNSMEYSAMNNTEKLRALMIFQNQWNNFLKEIIANNK